MFNLREALAQAARETAAAPYLRYRDDCITFSEADSALGRIASQLPSLAGCRVAILMPDSLTTALVHLHCFLQGATIIPLSPLSPAAHVHQVVDWTRADLVFTTPILRKKFSFALEKTGVVVVAGGVRDKLQIQSDMPKLGYRRGEKSLVRAIFFTSGTTGKPKGVCLSESNLLSAGSINSAILDLNSSRRSLLTVPLYDYYGLIQLYSHAFAKASCTLGGSGQFAKDAFRTISSQEITDIVLVPFTLKALLDYARGSKMDLPRATWSGVQHIASSSDQLPADLLQAAFDFNPDMTITNVYGLTEAGRACYRVIRKDSTPSASIGRASPTMKVWIDAPPGQTGEIVISGATVMLGYLRDVINGGICFDPVTQVRTADEGYIDGDGEIHLLGRKDHLMSLHGVKLHPSEIELAVNRIPGIRDSLAQVCDDQSGSKTVALSVVGDRERVSQNQILDLLRERIPRLFLPQSIRFVDAIPRTEIGGKLIRREH